jgi:hypothetical protein
MPKAPKATQDIFNMDTTDEYNPSEEREETPQTESYALTLDQLMSVSTDEEREESDHHKLNPPAGDWVKSQAWEFDPAKHLVVRTDDSMKGDINPNGRTFFNLFGEVDTRTDREGFDHTPKLFLRVSPDRRYKEDKPDDYDSAYKRYLEAIDLYMNIHGEKPENPGKAGKVLMMLIESSYTLRTMQGDNGLVVTGLKPNRKQRQ